MKKDKNKLENTTKNDPWYGKFETSMGVEVSGGAALLSRIKELGGMSSVIQKATAAGAMAAASEIAQSLKVPGKRK